ncbi:MAG: NAD(P)/FAD-dependent oxidoreductase [Shinella sp.]|nr:NAD(P)/FAD-dependent oxidoreductase [Shinella sp.]
MSHDVIVIGGSYAGMAAALQIARARRKLMVIDAGVRRNRFASHSHGFLSQDGVDPTEIAANARLQLAAYPNLRWLEGQVARAEGERDRFKVTMEDGEEHHARRLILALGVSDILPEVAGLLDRWGKTVFHCPYCHGYELGGGPIAVLAVGPLSMHQASLLPDWGPTTFLLNDAFTLDEAQRTRLDARGVTLETTAVSRISGKANVELADGRVLTFAGIFTAPRMQPSSPLAAQLGCAHEDGPLGPFLRTGPMKETTVSGIFACGDVARQAGSVSWAVGDGALAGAAVHQSLIEQ